MPTKIYAMIAGMGTALLAACGSGSVQAPTDGERQSADGAGADMGRLESWSGNRNQGNDRYQIDVVMDRAE